MRRRTFIASALAMATGLSAEALKPVYRPKREQRTLNTESYEVVLQKNGHVSLYRPSGVPIFLDVLPAIWIDGEKEPRSLDVDGRATLREEVRDKLGEGQGVIFVQEECEWKIRTYPTKPFLTMQVTFTNTKKKPVRVKMLSPWSVMRAKSGLTLGQGTREVPILENGRVFSANDDFPRLVKGESLSQWNLSMTNSRTNNSLIAGFLTNNKAYTQIRVGAGLDEAMPDLVSFQAECIYDAPIEVPPGVKLQSETLYLGVTESSPHEGLERYSHAYAVVNNISRDHAFLPHGWDSWNTHLHSDINQATMLQELDVLDRELKRYGWKHFAMDDGWQIARGQWEPEASRFPNGVKSIVDEVHARGMTAGLWTAPFTVAPQAVIAKARPEWLREPSALGKMVVREGDKIFDITSPGAYEYLRDVYRTIRKDWGVDALMEADYVYHLLLAESYHDASMTKIDVFRKGMQAVREGFGDDGFIMSFTPQPVTATIANGMRTGIDCAPIWRKQADKWAWGCVESLTAAARRYYFAPYCWAPDQDCAYFAKESTRKRWGVESAPPLTREQSIAWLTGAALTAGVVKIGDAFSELTPDELNIMRKLLPVSESPARPIDLFTSEHPAIWSLPIDSKIGKWHIVALFNWDETNPASISIDLREAGMQPHLHYVVYDFWNAQLVGRAQASAKIDVAPGSVRLLSFREFESRPQFLSIDNHILQGAHDFTALRWDEGTRALSGQFTAIERTDYAIRILAPAGYEMSAHTVSSGASQATISDRVVCIRFRAETNDPIDWRITF